MTEALKGKSPFYPGQPVPVELFVGRKAEIDRILQRGAGQTQLGKPVAFFVEGEYGIGKSSVASFVQRVVEEKHGLHAIAAQLGGGASLEDVGRALVDATLSSGAHAK